MFKFWKKSASSKTAEAPAGTPPAAAPAATEPARENSVSEISSESEIEIVNADKSTARVSLATLIASHLALENAKKNGEDCGEDAEVMHNGKTYKLNALIEAFDKWTKHNSDEEEKKKENAKKEPAPAVAPTTAAVAPEVKPEGRENGKGEPDHFRVLLNASARPALEPGPRNFNSLDERLARGAKMFGSKN